MKQILAVFVLMFTAFQVFAQPAQAPANPPKVSKAKQKVDDVPAKKPAAKKPAKKADAKAAPAKK